MKNDNDSNQNVINLPDRLLSFYKDVTERFNLSGANILEVGCGNGDLLKTLANAYPNSNFTGIDFKVGETPDLQCNYKMISGDATNLPFGDDSFDYVISLCVFEHIYDLKPAISEIKRVLRPGGTLYTRFSPIWTSVLGHHNMPNKAIAAPWAQLYMNEDEYMTHLLPHMDAKSAKRHAHHVYNRKDLNRLTRKDYYDIFLNSGMMIQEIREMVKFSRNGSKSELTPDIAERIKPEYCIDDLGIAGFYVCLKKFTHSLPTPSKKR